MLNKTNIIILLDRSGSMESIKEETISGFNEFLSNQKETSPEATISLIQFDHEYIPVYFNKELMEAEPLSPSTFIPRGMTALLDAIGKTIKDISRNYKRTPKEKRPQKVIFVIITDGLENMSRKYNREKIFKMLQKKQTKHNWKVIYLGANQDAISEAIEYGIDNKYSLTFAHDKAGTVEAFRSTNHLVSNMISGNDDAFFTEEDRKKQKRN